MKNNKAMIEKFIGFRFNTNNGFDHLACAVAANAVADNVRTVNPLEAGAIVVILAKRGEDYMVVSGVATGRILDTAAKDIWPQWGVTQTLVHEVIFKTRPVFVPATLACCPTTNISSQRAQDLAYYAFANG
jgi:hypothetical protein